MFVHHDCAIPCLLNMEMIGSHVIWQYFNTSPWPCSVGNLFVPLPCLCYKLLQTHNALTVSSFFHHSSRQNSNRWIALAIYTYNRINTNLITAHFGHIDPVAMVACLCTVPKSHKPKCKNPLIRHWKVPGSASKSRRCTQGNLCSGGARTPIIYCAKMSLVWQPIHTLHSTMGPVKWRKALDPSVICGWARSSNMMSRSACVERSLASDKRSASTEQDPALTELLVGFSEQWQ